jgi:hypothetical protein
MPPKGPVATHIVSRVLRAMRSDPNLTFKGAASELGISESSLYKMRKGTRTGQGSIAKRVMASPTRKSGQPQSVVDEFNVEFRTSDGKRVASRNIRVPGSRTKADALSLRHSAKTKKAIQRQLAKEAADEQRFKTGSPRWTKKEMKSVEIVGVKRVVRSSRPSYRVLM